MKIGRISVVDRGSSNRNGFVTGEMNASKQWSGLNQSCPPPPSTASATWCRRVGRAPAADRRCGKSAGSRLCPTGSRSDRSASASGGRFRSRRGTRRSPGPRRERCPAAGRAWRPVKAETAPVHVPAVAFPARARTARSGRRCCRGPVPAWRTGGRPRRWPAAARSGRRRAAAGTRRGWTGPEGPRRSRPRRPPRTRPPSAPARRSTSPALLAIPSGVIGVSRGGT